MKRNLKTSVDVALLIACILVVVYAIIANDYSIVINESNPIKDKYQLCIEYGKFRGVEMEYHTFWGCRAK